MDQLARLHGVALLPLVGIGFAAQLVDAALGMAFGFINSTLPLMAAVGLLLTLTSAHTIWLASL